MVNILKLKGKIIECGFTQDDFAKAIRIDKSTLSRKLKTGEDFTIGQANRIAKELNLTKEEALAIFFSHIVS